MARDNAAREFETERVVPIEKRKKSRDTGNEGGGSRFLTTDERREALGFVLVAAAVILFLSLVLNSSELRGVASSETPAAAGRFGRWIATQVGIMFGFGGLVIPLSLGAWGLAIFQNRPQKAIFAKGLALAVGLVAVCAGLGLVWERGYLGGALGDRLAADLFQTFGFVSYIVVFFTLAVSLVIGTPLSFSALGALIAAGAVKAWTFGVALEQKLAARLRASRGAQPAEAAAPAPAARAARPAAVAPVPAGIDPETGELQQGREYYDNAETRVVSTPLLTLIGGKNKKKKDEEAAEKPATVGDAPAQAPTGKASEKPAAAPVSPAIPSPSGTSPEELGSDPAVSTKDFGAIEKTAPTKPVQPSVKYTPLDQYTLPPISVLANPIPSTETVTEEDLKRKAQSLQDTLADHGINCKIGDIVPGPTVTRFEVVPAPGVKVSSIQSRADDISLAMAAPSIRIEAPIPGKSAVGIEIPNRKGHMVTLKEVIASDEFRKLRETSPLTVALGQDIAGQPVVVDLRKMPHLLIAGSTGSGKSVCLNSIINSILLSAKPTEVRLMMVDPKVVELKSYDDVPHLLSPVVTDARKAPRVLQWLVEEMERRYQYLARAGVRDIEGFNNIAIDPVPVSDTPDDFLDFEDELPSAADLPEKMPFILAIIDEFGDLMVIAKKECEDYIMRIVQMARAVGIHLIIATQRPSVNVITGVIKANMPSRLSFQVSSKVDSMTILDTMGAERLLGRGDMLFKPGDKPKPMRLQGVFIGTPEINDVIKHYAQQGPAKREVVLTVDEGAAMNNALAGEDDPLLEQAMRIALADGMASVSRLQRKLQVGHPRASRLVDIMEAKGLVTPPDGSKPRKLLFDASYFGNGDGGAAEG